MKNLKRLVITLFSFLMLLSCSALEEPVSSLDDGISKMQTLPVGSVGTTERTLSGTEPEYITAAAGIDSTMGTNFKIIEINDARVFDEGYTLGFNSSAIWLGSILDASVLPDSKFDEIVFDRAPYTFSISLKGNGKEVRGTVNGTRSAYEQKLSDLLSPDIVKSQPGSAEFSMDTIYSKTDLLYKVGFGVGLDKDGVSAKLSGLFDFSNKKIKSRVLVKFTQVYYSASIDKPSRPSKLFAEGLQFSEFQSKLSGNVSPVYVSAIKYGRMGYLSIESEQTEDVVNEALNAVLSSSNFNANLNISTTQSNVFKSSKIRVVMVGGGLSSMSNITGELDGFLQWIREATGEKDITSGMPIAFELSYLKNNRTAEIYKMNKQYAVVWYKINNGYIVRNKIKTDYSWGVSGNIYIKYVDISGNIITNITTSANNTLEINNSMNIPSDLLQASGKIIIGYYDVAECTPFGLPFFGKWNSEYSVAQAELNDNENIYVNWYQYSSKTGNANSYSQFQIEPIK